MLANQSWTTSEVWTVILICGATLLAALLSTIPGWVAWCGWRRERKESLGILAWFAGPPRLNEPCLVTIRLVNLSERSVRVRFIECLADGTACCLPEGQRRHHDLRAHVKPEHAPHRDPPDASMTTYVPLDPKDVFHLGFPFLMPQVPVKRWELRITTTLGHRFLAPVLTKAPVDDSPAVIRPAKPGGADA